MNVPTTLTCLALVGATAFAAPGDPASKTSPDARAPRGPAARTPTAGPAFEALSGPPPNDLCVNAAPVGVPSTTPGSTAGATFDPAPGCPGFPDAPGVWYQVTGTGNTVTASTCQEFGSDCCMSNGTPGCDNPDCEAAVCAVDAFCCDVSWDSTCAAEATDLCGGLCGYNTRLSVYCGDCGELSDCCAANGSPGCSNPGCEATVCAADPFCCDNQWDGVCAEEAADLCGSLCVSPLLCIDGSDNTCGAGGLQSEVSWCSQIGARYLVLVDGVDGATGPFQLTLSDDGVACEPTVQCLPPACQGDTNGDKDVDVNDLNNVIVGWGGDGQLGLDPITGQLINADITDAMGGPPDGIVNVNDLNAVIVNWGPCDPPPNDECEGKPDVPVVPGAVAVAILDMRGATPSAFGVSGCGNCNTNPAGPGCSDPTCEAIVCAVDPFCCDTEWDSVCAGEAEDLCDCALTPLCTEPAKDVWYCLSVPGFEGTITIATSLDLFAEIYEGCDCTQPPVLVACGPVQDGITIPVGAGDQFTLRLLNYANLPNGILVGELTVSSAVTCGVGAGDCCGANGSPGCNDLDCCNAVCAADPFCCDTEWDSVCADEAVDACGCPACGVPGTGDCCAANGTPFCNDADCCNTVCAIDAFCCDTSWDSSCAEEAIANCAVALCGPCGNNASGDCCEANGTPGCNDLDCCNTVCGADPFCCDNQWDGVCAGEAVDLCGGFCPG